MYVILSKTKQGLIWVVYPFPSLSFGGIIFVGYRWKFESLCATCVIFSHVYSPPSSRTKRVVGFTNLFLAQLTCYNLSMYLV